MLVFCRALHFFWKIEVKAIDSRPAEINLMVCIQTVDKFLNYNILMKNAIIFLLCSLLIVQSLAQTPNCSISTVPSMASGIIYLGVPAAATAQPSYTVTFSGQLGVFAELFPAFAMAGLQGASGQTFYSMVVDRITFSNGNSQMSFTMDYTYNQNGINYQTTWTKIKLSYVVVSTQFETVGPTLGNYVWAGSIGLNVPVTGLTGANMPNSIFKFVTGDDTSTDCGYINSSPPRFDISCAGNTATQGFVTHLYIMGFKFSPAGAYALGASALRNAGGQTTADLDEARQILTSTAAALNGPQMVIDSFGGQLKYIKISVVITTELISASYPVGNTAATFVYSGVYMNYTLYNVAKPIVKSSNGLPTDQNIRFTSLLNANYKIFGFSSFRISSMPSNMTQIDINLSLPDLNTALLQTDNTNYLDNVRVSADYWNSILINSCAPTVTEMVFIQQKMVSSVPALESGKQNIVEQSDFLTYKYDVNRNDAQSSLSSTVVFTTSIYYEQFVVGMSYGIQFAVFENPFTLTEKVNDATAFQVSLSIQGNTIINTVLTATTAADLFSFPTIGYIVSSATPIITITINMPRPANTSTNLINIIYASMIINQYSQVYDPASDCCVTKCPSNNGVNVVSSPPSCISCGNATGLVYNSISGTCQCKTGFYSVTQAVSNSTQCYPCFAQLCQSCNQSTLTICNACIFGAAFNNNTVCTCLTGFYQQNGICNACPYKCASCNVGTTCTLCSDLKTRDPNNNCSCLTGLYDAGSATCLVCSSLCLTCSSATSCTSCVTANNRALVNGQCVCATGFYQIVNPDGTLTCGQCSPQCTACSQVPTQCSNCDPSLNRILGYDSYGHQTCFCTPGYTQNSNGDCVQSNCNADPYCSNCQTVLSRSVCIKCIPSTNRVLVLPDQKCLCATGFYELNGICTPCSSGCQNCTSASSCKACVVSAISNNDGSCACPNGWYFVTTPIRYCKQCPVYCTSCVDANTCTNCKTNFTLLAGACTCSPGNFINNANCVPCINGCASCSNNASCLSCNNGLLLQNGSCVSRCSAGYYQDGFSCTACSIGCAFCEQANICTFCQAGKLAYNGFCYINCPPGSVAQTNTSTCVPCNAPCQTCVTHPSKCLTCSSCCGNLFNFECITNCPVGTYSSNGTCLYCSYQCATCLGKNTTCTSCPSGKILYDGACYDQCPYIMLGGICTFNCAQGLYKVFPNQCLKCDSTCVSCDVVAKNCTVCASGFSNNGICVQTCPNNTLALAGVCTKCSAQCNGCVDRCENCIACATGFYRCGAQCLATCPSNYYTDSSTYTCITCNPKCKTCSTAQFCTTCSNPQSVPVNGVCNDCSYPCNTCGSAPSVCTSCLSGFNLIGSTCISACPTGAISINGVCQCQTGILYSGQCVSSCPSGSSNIGGSCQQCSDTNCVSCSPNVGTCKACTTGFSLNSVTNVCEIIVSCKFGQYYSKSSSTCQRICPAQTYFYESVCLSDCLDGFADNGLGGCVQAPVQTGCSSPLFLYKGFCTSSCPAQTYPDTINRVCLTCSSNCFSCLSATFCYACGAGFDLIGGVCIASTAACPSGQFRYNSVCYATCPDGTCSQGTYCSRNCPAGSFSFNGGCYRTCPTKFNTADSCVNTCPIGTSLSGKTCVSNAQQCSAGQFFNSQTGSCSSCVYPCTSCSLTGSFCTACASGLTLNNNLCVSSSNTCGTGKYSSNGACATCPNKCGSCISATSCSTCASGYQFNGFDCVVSVNQLQPLVLTVQSTFRRLNIAFVIVCLNIIPNGLTSDQKSKFFVVVPNKGDSISYVNQWISASNNKCVNVAVTYATFPVQSSLFLAVNAQLLASAYSAIGYTADASSYVTANVNIGLTTAPDSLTIPNNSASIKSDSLGTVPSPIVANAINTNSVRFADYA